MSKNSPILPYALAAAGIAAVITTLGIIYFSKKKKTITCNSKFLFVGDSNIDTTISFADKLKSVCPGATVVKRADGSKQTSWMIDQLKDELASGRKYDVIAILGGSNDLGNPNQNPTYANLDAMYKMAKASGATVVAISPPNKNFLWGTTRFCPTSQSNCHAFPDGLQRLSKLVEYIRTNPNKDVFINYNKITDRKDFFQADMQHGNNHAQQALFEEFKAKVPVKLG